jgi:hypothetical protein
MVRLGMAGCSLRIAPTPQNAHPGAAVVLSIAIGVGANTAISTLVDAALLKPLPVKDADALRIVEWTGNGFPADVENINGDFGPGPGGRALGSP